MRQIVLDTETTGLDPREHRLTELGAVEIINRKLTGREYQTYLNPEREVEARASEITGLTWAMLKDKPKFKDKAQEFLDFIEGAELIIHNASFDLGFLTAELTRIKHPKANIEAHWAVIDTLRMARQMHPGQKNSLDALCKRYYIDNSHREHHGALLDSVILSKVYLAMTSGQTSLALEGHVEKHTVQQTLKVVNVLRSGDILIIPADEQELELHQRRLQSIKERSGSCLWQEIELTTL